MFFQIAQVMEQPGDLLLLLQRDLYIAACDDLGEGLLHLADLLGIVQAGLVEQRGIGDIRLSLDERRIAGSLAEI